MVICLERGADCFAYGPADATASQNTPLSLALFKSRLVLPFWYWLIQVVLEKRQLNGCSSSSSLRITVLHAYYMVNFHHSLLQFF